MAEPKLRDLAPSAQEFRSAVVAGLSRTPKTLPCKFFYDETGARLFETICTLEEYYRFSELDCRDLSVHPDARNGVPPDPVTVRPGDAPRPEPAALATLYLRDSDPVTLPCHGQEQDLDELLSILKRRAASGESSDRVRRLCFADRTIRFRESDLVSEKIDKAG